MSEKNVNYGWLKDYDGNEFIPITHSTKVYDNDGKTVEERLSNAEQAIDDLEAQEGFKNIKAGSTTIVADSAEDTLEIAAGTGISVVGDATNDKVTIGHSNTVTAKTSFAQTTDADASGENFTVSELTYDAQGHITGKQDKKITLPKDISGNAATASKLKTPITVTITDNNGHNGNATTFDGSSAATLDLPDTITANIEDKDGEYFFIDRNENVVAKINASGFQATDVTTPKTSLNALKDAFDDLSDDVITEVIAGSGLAGGGSAGSVTLNVNVDRGLSIVNDKVGHSYTAGTNTTSTANPGYGKTFTVVDSVTKDTYGHVTKVNTKTVTMPGEQTVNNATITIAAGKGLTTGGDFTTNQSSNETITLNVGAGAGISVQDDTVTNAGVRSVAKGTKRGTIAVNTNGTTADVAVNGLGFEDDGSYHFIDNNKKVITKIDGAGVHATDFIIDGADTSLSGVKAQYTTLKNQVDTTKYAASPSVGGPATSANKVNKALTVGTKTFDGSTAVTITASDLGLAQAMKFLGTSKTAITDGATTNPITIGSTSTTVTSGNVVLYGTKEFVWTGSKWEELGNEGSYKVKQTAVASPSASGNASAFIDTIKQDENGNITATKKNVQITIDATATDDDVVVLTATDGTNAVTYDAKHAKKGPSSGYTSGNTETSISGSGDSGTIKIPQLTVDAYGHVTAAADENVTIAMPTVNNTTITIKAGTGLKTGGSFTTNQSSASTITLDHSNSVTAKTTYQQSADASGSGASFKLTEIKYDAQGHVTGSQTKTITMPSSVTGNAGTADKWKTGRSFSITDNAGHTGTATTVDGSAAVSLDLPDTIAADLVGNITTTDDHYAFIDTKNNTLAIIQNGGIKTVDVFDKNNNALSTAVQTVTASGTAPLTLTATRTGNNIAISGSMPAATASQNGYMTSTQATKLNGIATGAEVNQNAFSNVVVNSTTIAADTKTDTLTMVGNKGITITPDATNDKITISHSTTGGTDVTTAAGKAVTKLTIDDYGHVTATGTSNVINSVTTDGSGNAITSASVSNGVLTLTKGATYNNYSLPTATDSVLGGVKLSDAVAIFKPEDAPDVSDGIAATPQAVATAYAAAESAIEVMANNRIHTILPGTANGSIKYAKYTGDNKTEEWTDNVFVQGIGDSGDGNFYFVDNANKSNTYNTNDGMHSVDFTIDGVCTVKGLKTSLDSLRTDYNTLNNAAVKTITARGTAPLTLGAIKSGNNVSITGSIASATASNKGIVKVDDSIYLLDPNKAPKAASGTAASPHAVRMAIAAAEGMVNGLRDEVNKKSDADTTYSFSTGDGDGQIKITPSSGSAYNVTIKGLGDTAGSDSGYLKLSGGTMSGHIYLGGSVADSSTSNTSQLIFGTPETEHVAISSNDNAIIINRSSDDTERQIQLQLDIPSVFPSGMNIGQQNTIINSGITLNTGKFVPPGVVIGTNNIANDRSSLVVGYNNETIETYESHSDITENSISNLISGWDNVIAGSYSSALGGNNRLKNTYNVCVIGDVNNVSDSDNVIALGHGLIADNIFPNTVDRWRSQIIIGNYNINDTDAIFIVGNGTGTGEDSNRNNAFVIKKDGSATLPGTMSIGCLNCTQISGDYIIPAADNRFDIFTNTSKTGTATLYVDNKKVPTMTTQTITIPADTNLKTEFSVTCTGVTSSNTVIVSPAPRSLSDYSNCGIYCSGQGTNQLKFLGEGTPTIPIIVQVIILN